MKLTLGFSSCPNDTFIFDALVNSKIKHSFEFDTVIADVEELNRLAMQGKLSVSKLSYQAYAHVASKYLICESGSALGRGNGPLFVGTAPIVRERLSSLKVAIPGRYTTAAFLLKYAFPEISRTEEYLFSDIENAVLEGKVDAGALIHEGRFTYSDKGLQLLQDLGEYWETTTGQAIPLGCIALSRDLPPDVQQSFSAALKASVLFAQRNPQSSAGFVRRHAQISDDTVIARHIGLFVNEYTVALGEEGRRAAEFFLAETLRLGFVDRLPEQIFAC